MPSSWTLTMSNFTKGWVEYLRNNSRQEAPAKDANTVYSCNVCDAEVPHELDAYRAHVRRYMASHASLDDDAAIDEAFRNLKFTTRP